MKKIEEIESLKRVKVINAGINGGCGEIRMINWKGSVIWSIEDGWEHVSVAPFTHSIVPSWKDMCMIKDMFFYEEEEVIQIHPKKSEYVNLMENCLHLWRHQDMALPPSDMA